MKKLLLIIISYYIGSLALADQAPKEIAKFMPDCSFVKSSNSKTATSYIFHCEKDETLTPPEELTQCRIDSKDKKIIDCALSSTDSKAASNATKLKINCIEEGTTWVKHQEKHQWTCTITAPEIAGCKYTHESELTGFYEYDCGANARLIETEIKGKCEAGDTNSTGTAYYCFSPQTSADTKLMLKCASGWVRSPTNATEFSCGTAPTKKQK